MSTAIDGRPVEPVDPPPAKSIADLRAGSIVENRIPLSESRLWDLQRQFYRSAGLGAWGDGGIPHQITCNPVIARGYAEVIVAFLRDSARAGRLNPERAVQIVELGSGSGRFAFQLVRHLRPLLEATELRGHRVTLVLTDFDPTKVAQLAEHPALQRFRDEGWMDFATIDASRTTGTAVQTWAGEPIGGGPMVVIANYVFDSLPAQAYAIRTGTAHLARLTVTAGTAGLDLMADDALAALGFDWTTDPAPAPSTGNPDLDAVLAHYAATLNDTTVLLPTTALACIDGLAATSGDAVLLLAADKGWAHLADLAGLGDPAIVPHNGCFSLMVDFDALARVVRGRGGSVLLPPHTPRHLVVGGFVLGDLPVPETRMRFAGFLGEGGVDDVFEIRGTDQATLSLGQALATLRLSGWDSHVFLPMFPALLALAPDTAGADRIDLALALRRVWEGWFPIGETADLAICVGLLLSAIGEHRQALGYFDRSHEQHGRNANAFLAAAIAHQGLGEPDEALKDLTDALSLEPGLDAARSLLIEIEAALGMDDGGACRC